MLNFYKLHQIPYVVELQLKNFLNESIKGYLIESSCSKCRTLKTLSGTVSVQVQPVSYKCQLGHNSSVINVNPMDMILSALNVTQGHKCSYQTSS